MGVISELLPSAYFVRAEEAKKDRQQQHHQRKPELAEYHPPSESEGGDQAPIDVSLTPSYFIVDRRNNNNRRKAGSKRGRWLESRQNKDRRAKSISICVKI